jgi:hypothetical protein
LKTRKLTLACPVCGSREVFYSCTPNCCFNHVCAACNATFEPATRAAGGVVSGLIPPDPLPDSTEATVECVKCASLAVYECEDGRVACAACGAVLTVEYTEVVEA